jgi:hydroxymethylbilane synthase
MASPNVLRLGTRASLLAQTQSGHVAAALCQAHPGLIVELKTISTSGDLVTDRPLAEVGGKGLFTKELELALLAGQIDFAVHSLKDVPVTEPLVDQADLVIAAIPVREDPRDLLVCRSAKTVAEIPLGATVGTGSLRRRCQILDARPDLNVALLRGNVDTRLKKLDAGEYEAIVIALAGVKRIGRFDGDYMNPIDPSIILPAAGQGALAVQCRREDHATRELLAVLDDPNTAAAVAAERAVVSIIGADCHSPIAVFATFDAENPPRLPPQAGPLNGEMSLYAALGRRDGNPPVTRAWMRFAAGQWQETAAIIARKLAGAGPMI